MSKMLSEHFSAAEFMCHDGSSHAINPILLKKLEALRTRVKVSVHIDCGYRSPAYNATLKGAAKHSQHMLGNAADIKVAGFTPKQIYDLAIELGFTGIGLYDTFTHVDVRPGRLATWDLRTKKGMK